MRGPFRAHPCGSDESAHEVGSGSSASSEIRESRLEIAQCRVQDVLRDRREMEHVFAPVVVEALGDLVVIAGSKVPDDLIVSIDELELEVDNVCRGA